MCSPEFLERHGDSLKPKDLHDIPQIGPQDPWWAHWLREAGVDVPERPPKPGVRLGYQAHEGFAAMAGQGMAMLTPFFWRNDIRSEEHTSELQSLMRISYAVFCLKKKTNNYTPTNLGYR